MNEQVKISELSPECIVFGLKVKLHEPSDMNQVTVIINDLKRFNLSGGVGHNFRIDGNEFGIRFGNIFTEHSEEKIISQYVLVFEKY